MENDTQDVGTVSRSTRSVLMQTCTTNNLTNLGVHVVITYAHVIRKYSRPHQLKS